LHVAERALGFEPKIRDIGLLEAAAARPAASTFGRDAYPDLDAKAAALLHSLAGNHALVDGNKRLAPGRRNRLLRRQRIPPHPDQAYELVMAVADGRLDDVAAIATRLGQATEPRP
jgi:death-on-curing protein